MRRGIGVTTFSLAKLCIRTSLCLVFSVLSFAPLTSAEEIPLPAEDILAVVGDATITKSDFVAELTRRGLDQPGRTVSGAQKAALLKEMVRNALLYESALRAGYDKKPEIMDAVKQLLIYSFREEMLEPARAKISVSDGEIEAYYRQNPNAFEMPRMVRAAIIQISVPEKVTDEKKAALRKRAEQARSDSLKLEPSVKSFGSVAVAYSDDQASRYKGGDTGFITQNDDSSGWEKAVVDAVFSLKKEGEISPLITGEKGFYLVRMIEIKEGGLRAFEDVKEMIRAKLLFDRKNEVEKQFYAELEGRIRVSVNEDLLKKIEAPGAALMPVPPPLPGGGLRR